MILERPNIKHQTELVNAANVEASHSISQLMMFNSVQHVQGNNASSHVRHKRVRMPFSLYLAMKIHDATRSNDTFHDHGMCVSCDWLMKLTSDISNCCKSVKAALNCTPLCSCSGAC